MLSCFLWNMSTAVLKILKWFKPRFGLMRLGNQDVLRQSSYNTQGLVSYIHFSFELSSLCIIIVKMHSTQRSLSTSLANKEILITLVVKQRVVRPTFLKRGVLEFVNYVNDNKCVYPQFAFYLFIFDIQT